MWTLLGWILYLRLSNMVSGLFLSRANRSVLTNSPALSIFPHLILSKMQTLWILGSLPKVTQIHL